jgi:hypothetical protein
MAYNAGGSGVVGRMDRPLPALHERNLSIASVAMVGTRFRTASDDMRKHPWQEVGLLLALFLVALLPHVLTLDAHTGTVASYQHLRMRTPHRTAVTGR